MEQHSLETTDIFRGAFFLCMGGDLHGIRIKGNGRRTASFMIRGNDLNRLDREYRSGQALVNPIQLRESLNHLRDILFETLQENNPPSPRLRRTDRRMRDDRERENRRVKKEH